MKFRRFVLKVLSGNEILTPIKGNSSATNVQKMVCNINANLDIANISAYTKLGKILSFFSQDIELKRNSDRSSDINQGPHLFDKLYVKQSHHRFCQYQCIYKIEILSICSQYIEQKLHYDGRME